MYQSQLVGLYCRLSKDDGNDSVSNSIQNQEKILINYCKDHNISNYKLYIDDGYSGTNFERPAYIELMNNIDCGLIKTIITKDLSRLGRNYIQVGKLIEEIFPLKKVRFIALNDNYDSNYDDNNDMIAIKNIFNETLAKETSKKVKLVKRMKAKEGKILRTCIPLYGYKYDDKSERVIEPYTSSIVQKIFDKYIETHSTSRVIKYLEEQKIPNLSFYNLQTYNYRASHYDFDIANKYKWKKHTIKSIIRNKEYLGHYIVLKTTKISYKLKKRIKNKGDATTIHLNRFPAIISQETFDKANYIMDNIKTQRAPATENPYPHLLVCGHCGKKLQYHKRVDGKNNDKKYRYFCKNTNCDNRAYINVNKLDEILKSEINAIFKEILKKEQKFVKQIKPIINNVNNSTSIDLLKVQELEVDILIERVFEEYSKGVIPESAYLKMIEKYKDKKRAINEEIKRLELENKRQNAIQLSPSDKITEIKKVANGKYDLIELVRNIVDEIIVSGGKYRSEEKLSIKIIYKQNDIFEESMKKCKEQEYM